MEQHKKQVLILSSASSLTNQKLNDSFVDGLNIQLADTATVTWAHYDDIGFSFINNTISVFWVKTGEPLQIYDFVYIKSYYRYMESALTIVEFCIQSDTRFVCSELETAVSFSKLSQYARLCHAGLPIPPTLFIPRSILSHSYEKIATSLGVPFILKAVDAKGGDANFLIADNNAFTDALKQYPDVEFVSQTFIPNASDLRVLVLGDTIELVIQRSRTDDTTHLNNTSQGGSAQLLSVEKLDAQTATIVLTAAKLLNREIAGVDIMFASDTGKPYILEVNASPQVASGAFVEEKVEKYGQYIKNMLE